MARPGWRGAGGTGSDITRQLNVSCGVLPPSMNYCDIDRYERFLESLEQTLPVKRRATVRKEEACYVDMRRGGARRGRGAPWRRVVKGMAHKTALPMLLPQGAGDGEQTQVQTRALVARNVDHPEDAETTADAAGDDASPMVYYPVCPRRPTIPSSYAVREREISDAARSPPSPSSTLRSPRRTPAFPFSPLECTPPPVVLGPKPRMLMVQWGGVRINPRPRFPSPPSRDAAPVKSTQLRIAAR